MLRLLKYLFIFVVLVILALVGAVVGIGFITEPAFDTSDEVIVARPPAEVFAVVGDPRKAASWAPPEAGHIDRVELLAQGRALIAAAGLAAPDAEAEPGSDEEAAALEALDAPSDAPTHRYHLADGSRIDMRIERFEPGSAYGERVIAGEEGIRLLYPEASWGFELEPVTGDPSQTRLRVLRSGVATRPFGTFVTALSRWSGAWSGRADELGREIELAGATVRTPADGEEPVEAAQDGEQPAADEADTDAASEGAER